MLRRFHGLHHMTDRPPPEDKRSDADEAFQATLRNLVNTPHKPHAPLAPKSTPIRDPRK